MAYSLSVLIKRDVASIKCPSCKEYNCVRRSHSRTMMEKVINTLTFQKLYRCKKCGWRGRKFIFVLTKSSVKTLILYFFLALVSLGVTRLILSKIFH